MRWWCWVGSLPGVVLGALIFTALPEVLRSIQLAGYLFYGAGLVGLLVWLRPFWRFATVLGGVIVAGWALNVLVNLLWPGLDSGGLDPGSPLNELVRSWLIIPQEYTVVGYVATVAALATLLFTLVARSPLRWWVLGLTIYLLALAWETRLALEPAATRILIVGATLVVLMIMRPQGLLGKQEVRIV